MKVKYLLRDTKTQENFPLFLRKILESVVSQTRKHIKKEDIDQKNPRFSPEE